MCISKTLTTDSIAVNTSHRVAMGERVILGAPASESPDFSFFFIPETRLRDSQLKYSYGLDSAQILSESF